MNDSVIHIADYASLLDLRESIRNTADQLMMTVKDVSAHFDTVLSAMQQKVALLQREEDAARRQLEAAERALSDCEASQEYDEEDGCNHPSCSSEASAVRSARSDYDDCRKRREEVERILADCRGEVEKWHEPIGMIVPGGGYAVMEHLCGEHTEAAIRKLSDIIDVVEDILATPVTLGSSSVTAEQVREQMIDANTQESEEERNRAYEEKFSEAEERLKSMARRNDYKKATGVLNQLMENREVLCPYCHRPKIACICARDPKELERDRGPIWEILKTQQR